MVKTQLRRQNRDHAASLVYRWCNPPTLGSSTTHDLHDVRLGHPMDVGQLHRGRELQFHRQQVAPSREPSSALRAALAERVVPTWLPRSSELRRGTWWSQRDAMHLPQFTLERRVRFMRRRPRLVATRPASSDRAPSLVSCRERARLTRSTGFSPGTTGGGREHIAWTLDAVGNVAEQRDLRSAVPEGRLALRFSSTACSASKTPPTVSQFFLAFSKSSGPVFSVPHPMTNIAWARFAWLPSCWTA